MRLVRFVCLICLFIGHLLVNCSIRMPTCVPERILLTRRRFENTVELQRRFRYGPCICNPYFSGSQLIIGVLSLSAQALAFPALAKSSLRSSSLRQEPSRLRSLFLPHNIHYAVGLLKPNPTTHSKRTQNRPKRNGGFPFGLFCVRFHGPDLSCAKLYRQSIFRTSVAASGVNRE